MLDVPLLKLQYEILNKTVDQLSEETGLPLASLQKEIDYNGWKQWWPEDEEVRLREKQATSAEDEEIDASEVLALQSEMYIDRAKRRLAVYTLAKEIYLAQKYMKLESALIDKAHDVLEGIQNIDSRSIKELSALYKDMTAKSPMSALAAFTFGEDEGGVPTVIVRDLSGRQ